ncbi:MAG: EAL domain-containing protein [Leptolyngbyaceae cyanobacterium SM2_3_12]|nr:EAL domain-containing protein [Leptolyngbyaceae cyanobacterium SM2_3_12]
MIGGPITALCSGLLIALSIQFARQSEGLDHELTLGLKNQELVIHYQPILDLNTGACVGSEALLRWYHPEQGVLPPSLFIPIAEKTGLINDIGEWLIKQIAQEQAKLYDQFPGLYTSINFSPSQLDSGRLDPIISWLMNSNLCAPDRFIIEVTETPVVQSASSHASDSLARLRSLGMRIALDDFGQGYSGLSYLHRFDIDQLKIDLYYVAAINKEPQVVEILETIIALGHKLGLTLVAEGIETEEQLQFLRDRGVHYGQGWLFSRPVPIPEFERYLTTHRTTN